MEQLEDNTTYYVIMVKFCGAGSTCPRIFRKERVSRAGLRLEHMMDGVPMEQWARRRMPCNLVS